MRTGVKSLFFAALVVAVTGCAGVTVNREALVKVKKAAIIGVYCNRLWKGSEANHNALKKVLEDSTTILAQELKENCGWEVMDLQQVRSSPVYKKATSKLTDSKWVVWENGAVRFCSQIRHTVPWYKHIVHLIQVPGMDPKRTT